MFSSNPAKSLGEKALSGKGVEMADKVKNLTDEAKSQAEMADKAKNLASQMKSQAEHADKVASELKSQADLADKAKNLATGSGAQGLASTGGMGLGNVGLGKASGLGAAAAGVGGLGANALRTGAGYDETSNPHAFNRDSSHSGYGGHNTNTDSYGRDTTNSETYGRGNTRSGMNEGYSMSNDRDQLRQNLNQSGNTGNSSAFGTGDLARDTGTGTHHHATDKDFGTSSTRTGVHSGDGIHSQQYHGRTDGEGSTYVSGGSTGIGHHPHATGQQGTGIGHHQVGEGIHARQYAGRSGLTGTSETVSAMGTGAGHHDQHSHHDDCEFCRKYGGSQRNTTSTGTAVPASYTTQNTQDRNKEKKTTTSGVTPSSAQDRNINTTSTTSKAATSSAAASASTNKNNLPPYGDTVMTTTTSSNTTEGPSPYHLRLGETIVEKETRVHRGVPAGTGTHITTTTGISQPTAGQMNTGGSVSQPQQRRKSSVGEKLMDKMSGKTQSVGTTNEAARTINPSRN